MVPSLQGVHADAIPSRDSVKRFSRLDMCHYGFVHAGFRPMGRLAQTLTKCRMLLSTQKFTPGV